MIILKKKACYGYAYRSQLSHIFKHLVHYYPPQEMNLGKIDFHRGKSMSCFKSFLPRGVGP